MGSFLVLVGIVGVLATTFVAGVWTGRNWSVMTGGVKPPQPAEPATRARASTERPRAAETMPALTFYQALTAPLTAPPPPARATKPPRPPDLVKRDAATDVTRDGLTEPPAAAEPSARRETPLSAAPPLRTEAPTPPASFTVQVAAYNARPPADALCATLAAVGHDARVIEAPTASGVRYRVQVGVFTTRQAAQDAAARLTAERSLPTFVTSR